MSTNFRKFPDGGIGLIPRTTDPASPSEGDLQMADGTARAAGLWQYLSGAWVKLITGSVGTTVQTCYLKDYKSATTAGGTFTLGSFQTRVLNTIEGDSSIVSLASNQFELQAGTYEIEAICPAYTVGVHQAILYNVTDAATSIIGNSPRAIESGNGGGNQSELIGRVVIAGAKTFEIRHRCTLTVTTEGLGKATNWNASEVYTQVKISKVA